MSEEMKNTDENEMVKEESNDIEVTGASDASEISEISETTEVPDASDVEATVSDIKIQESYIAQDFKEDTDKEDTDIEDVESEEDVKKRKKQRRRTIGKAVLFAGQIIAIFVMIATLVLLLMPNAKMWLLTTPIGKYFVKQVVTDDDYENILDKDYNREEKVVNEGVDTDILDNYTNFALFGLDSRKGELESGVRSDSIIIVSIHKETKEVKLCSVYRDTWLEVIKKDGSTYYNKINTAYAYGGPECAVDTLNRDLDLNIKDYVSVNFYGLTKIIDMLGGIDVNISNKEQFYINGYLTETRKITGLNAPDVATHGQVHLSGLQAVAFCRIRYVPFTDTDGTVLTDDMGRTARQRFVITQLVEKAKAAGIDELMKMVDEVFHGNEEIIKTSIPYDDLLDLLPVLMEFSVSGKGGFPTTYRESIYKYTNNESAVLACGFSYNVMKLHQFLYDDFDYRPSNTVKYVDQQLATRTLAQEVRLPEDQNNPIYD